MNRNADKDHESNTFWSSAKEILLQVHQLLRASGVAAWICKDYVKGGKRVPFCDNWAKLCEACGFVVIERARCWLVKEETHAGLFGEQTKRTERKSFFRRLAEKKGSPRIDFEEVIFVRKVGDGGDFAACVGSPPFSESLGDKPSAGLLKGSGGRMGKSQKSDVGYGQTPGQLGAMKEGDVEDVLP